MSAIDTTFHWVRNPTAINGLATTYVSKRGSDVSGNGTANNPYASIAKATSVATSGTNIMLDDGEWNEDRTNNNKWFNYWGNGNSKLTGEKSLRNVGYDISFNFFFVEKFSTYGSYSETNTYNHCVIKNCTFNSVGFPLDTIINNSICKNISQARYNAGSNSVFIDCSFAVNFMYQTKNSIFINHNWGGFANITAQNQANCDYNNFTNGTIPTNQTYPNANSHSINNSTTGQTLSDYFNKYDVGDWLQCDFTAKEGSANIGAGEKGITIGLNQGFTMYADNSVNDVFKESNGATLKNIAWDSNLNGYTLVQKERFCQGATSNTITLDSSASAVDDYYNNLFIGIVGGDGYGELFLITDYDGATKTATIDGTWATTPTANNSIYTISGTILSAVKDLGKAIKVKRNWTFADNFTALQDGQWAEFMTHVTNGKQFSTSCYSYEYSTDGVNFVQGQTADDLVSAINGENKVTDAIYGDCSPNYDESTAKNLVLRYIRVRVHIGFNIGQLGE